ncbi:MAG: hypothetical protein IV099_22540 [Phenylobacterium sp.]|nr:hypothetical protein [Phenylobacterium sp.]
MQIAFDVFEIVRDEVDKEKIRRLFAPFFSETRCPSRVSRAIDGVKCRGTCKICMAKRRRILLKLKEGGFHYCLQPTFPKWPAA